ncbi:hypothetical protein [Pseudoxanthomonas sp.]|jgi:hypothetical protein|uniref:hypothetical protein n=1 Tax=Pseudoxanthomonas sp. TaxID=1871049 RepID=UPI002E1201FF|nr:hypothetical protein [Pseudoxanthomonas sp.]
MIVAALFAMSVAAGDDTAFELAGTRIGLGYTELRQQRPEMQCDVSCVDPTAKMLGHPGNLWVGIGHGAVNQLAFRFVPALTDQEATSVSSAYQARYGEPARRNALDGCEEWDRAGGAIVLCVRNGLSLTYWKDENWGVTKSVIPDAAE